MIWVVWGGEGRNETGQGTCCNNLSVNKDGLDQSDVSRGGHECWCMLQSSGFSYGGGQNQKMVVPVT